MRDFHRFILSEGKGLAWSRDRPALLTADLYIIGRVRLEAALRRKLTVWHQSTARVIRMHRIRLLSYRSRGTLMSYGDHSAQRCFKLNAPFDRRCIKLPREQNETSPRGQALQLLKIGCESLDDDTLYFHWSDSVMTSTTCVACLLF